MALPPVVFDGTLPGPIGNVAIALHATDAATHTQRSIELHRFLVDPEKVLLQLNMDHTPRTCVVGMPNSSKVRILHSIGIGASGIGSVSPIDNQLLFLTGDGGPDIGTPLPLVLPPETLALTQKLCLTQEQFIAQINAQGATYTFPLVRRSNAADTTETVMQIAPIPSFLILDGLSMDLDAAEVLERVLSMDDTTGEMYMHLKSFLRCCLTGHNMGDESCRLPQEILNAPHLAQARLWANSKFKNSYPTLNNTPPAGAAAPDYAAILAPFLQAQMEAQQNLARANRVVPEEKKDDEGGNNPTLTMSVQEFNTTLQMCGLPPRSPPETLPEWIRDYAAKGQDSFRNTIIRRHIMNNVRYEDAEVQITNSILKMASK